MTMYLFLSFKNIIELLDCIIKLQCNITGLGERSCCGQANITAWLVCGQENDSKHNRWVENKVELHFSWREITGTFFAEQVYHFKFMRTPKVSTSEFIALVQFKKNCSPFCSNSADLARAFSIRFKSKDVRNGILSL